MSWLKYKNIHSDAMGLTVDTYPPIVRAEQRVDMVRIPGKHGEVTLQGGAPVYEAQVRECVCVIQPGADIPALASWLTGQGDLILGNEPDYAYDARVLGEVPFTKILREREYREIQIPFFCQPLKKLVATEADVVVTASGSFITNPGHVESRPLIKVEGSGTVRVMIGTASITMITGLNGAILLDSEIGIATNTTQTTNMSPLVSGDWPVIPTGKVPISWTGTITKLTITPRWRWL